MGGIGLRPAEEVGEKEMERHGDSGDGISAGWDGRADDAMVKELDLDNNRPGGNRLRLAGPVGSGWRIVSLWDSEAAWQDFRDNRLAPAPKRAGRSVPPVEIWPVERVWEAG
jgi:hypothetical protein